MYNTSVIYLELLINFLKAGEAQNNTCLSIQVLPIAKPFCDLLYDVLELVIVNKIPVECGVGDFGT